MNCRFRWHDRLHGQREFSQVYEKGRRYGSAELTVWVYRAPGESSQGPRLGLAIPGAYGNAVARNRLKRLLREVFRLNKSQLPAGVDLVFYARKQIPGLRYPAVESRVKKLWTQAGLL